MDKKAKFPTRALIVCVVSALFAYVLSGGWSFFAGGIAIGVLIAALIKLFEFLQPHWPQISAHIKTRLNHLKEGVMAETTEAVKPAAETPTAALPGSKYRMLFIVGIPTLVLFALVENEMPGWATVVLVALLGFLAWTGDFNVVSYARRRPLRLAGYALLYVVIGTSWSFGKWFFFVQEQHDEYVAQKRVFIEKHGLTTKEIPPSHQRGWVATLVGVPDEWIDRHCDVEKFRISDPDLRSFLGNNLNNDWILADEILENKKPFPEVLKRAWAEYQKRVNDDNAENKRAYEAGLEACYRNMAKQATRRLRPEPGEYKSQITLWMTYWPWSMTWTVVNDPVKRAFKYTYERVQEVYTRITNRVFRDLEKDLPKTPAPVPTAAK